MRRRDFIAGLGGVTALPFASRAQQAMPVVGFLRSTSLADATHLVTAFRQGLKEAGFVEGQNVAIELASGEGRPERTPALIIELVRRQVAVIVSETVSAMAVKAARVLAGVLALGRPAFLDPDTVRRLGSRADEKHRRDVLARSSAGKRT